MTASVGVRWEYYPFPTRTDRGLEMFDFTRTCCRCAASAPPTRRCATSRSRRISSRRASAGRTGRPRTRSFASGSRAIPQSDNAITRVNGIAQAFPQIMAITQSGPNTFTPVGSLNEGVPVVPQLDLSTGTVRLPAGAGVTTLEGEFLRGTITSWNVTVQKLFPHSLSVQVGYVANRQSDQTRAVNLNYGQIGGGAASQPFNQPGLANGLRTTAAMNVFRPVGKVTYDSLQLSVTRRMIEWLPVHVGVHLREGNRLVGRQHRDPGILRPEQSGAGWRYRRSGRHSTPHKVDASVIYQLPFGEGRTIPQRRRRRSPASSGTGS